MDFTYFYIFLMLIVFINVGTLNQIILTVKILRLMC